MHIGFISQKITIDDIFILRRLQEDFPAKLKMMYMCIVDLEKAVDGMQWIVF